MPSNSIDSDDANDDVREEQVLHEQVRIPEIKVSYRSLFRYSNFSDTLLYWCSICCSLAAGAALPLMTIVFGKMAGTFQAYFAGTTDDSRFSDEIHQRVLYLVYMALGEFVTVYGSTVGFVYCGDRAVQNLRERYVSSVLRQNAGLFDNLGAGEITGRITLDMNLVQDGISQKLGLIITGVSTFLAALIIGFVKSWQLTLILISCIVAMFLSMTIVAKFMAKYNKNALEFQGLAGTFADEVFTSIKMVASFDTNHPLERKFDELLADASKWGFKSRAASACLLGTMLCIVYLQYGLSFWQGSRFVESGDATLSDVLTILLAIMMAGSSLGSIAPYNGDMVGAAAAGGRIIGMIDRKSLADPLSEEGRVLEHVEGVIELVNVRHVYPSRPKTPVLRSINLKIPAGKTMALVGISGSGKSSIIELIERFYYPIEGQVLLDGHDLQELNLRWLRQQFALVGQEPVLFRGSVAQNIEYGLIGTGLQYADSETKMALVVEAAKMANVHQFLTSFPEGYDTNVGDRGFLFSGGQRQRIAIARALISNPKILFLDEATASLDTHSESVVQDAITRAARIGGRTTLVIAHRLSTIKDADNIVVLSEGMVIEQGTHTELVALGGAYSMLVETQRITEPESDDSRYITDDKMIEGASLSDTKQEESNRQRSDHKHKHRFAATPNRYDRYSMVTLLNFIWSFQKQDYIILTVGLLCSIICGGGMPTQAVFLGKAVAALSLPASEASRGDISFWARMYLMLAIVELFAFITQGLAFGYLSERLVFRVRHHGFRVLLAQEIAFFEREENSVGTLISLLISDAGRLASISGATLGAIIVLVTTLIASISISTAVGWQLGLVCTATIPLLLACGFLRFWLLSSFEIRSKKAYTQSANFACEAISAVRTVASLTLEREVCAHYGNLLTAQMSENLTSTFKLSILYAASQSLTFLCMALGFWYGSTLISTGHYSLLQFFICFTSVIFGAQSAGGIFSYAPDMGRAKQAAQSFKELFSRRPTIVSGDVPCSPSTDGNETLQFQNVSFSYPSRPDYPTLKNINLTVKANQYIALVGPSGCGKTTCIELTQRFLDPDFLFNGEDIANLEIQEYRRCLVVVSQYPFILRGTIRDNLLLGAIEPILSEEKLTQACKDAHIHDFIISLPEGLETVVGPKGVRLSGGQKQRLTIARALVREPKILLLDEATSALDSESEAAVQNALETARCGRTTITVAHRLSTIQNAETIYVLDAGEIVESGAHAELLARRGRYAEMVKSQRLGDTR